MRENHKFKLAGLASVAMLMLPPISGACTSVTQLTSVHAEKTWDYDTDQPGLGKYDTLLQNAGPSDMQVDWYPAERFASSNSIRASQLVKQLIELSIATNDSSSIARHVLFNNTTGNNSKPGYKEIYDKYNLALGFIAQILDFNNQRVGAGAYLHQGYESTSDGKAGSFHAADIIAATGKTPDSEILKIPKIGEGRNISDILGTALFGDADKGYAQLYVNGYDNVSQNEANIIRESTTSITLVAQSSLTGRKATAIYKLNNKTFNILPEKVLLENNIDNSPYSSGKWGTSNIPDDEAQNLGDSMAGTFNQRTNLKNGLTNPQKRLIGLGGSTAWVDPNTGSGTIVVPRGTDAKTIAKKIKKLGYQSNYNISNVAPMKAIHGDLVSGTLAGGQNSYNVSGTWGPDGKFGRPLDAPDTNTTLISNDKFTDDGKPVNNYVAVADPRLKYHPGIGKVTGVNKLKENFTNSLLFNPFNTNFASDMGIGSEGYSNKTAGKIPNQADATNKNTDAPRGASSTTVDPNFKGTLDFWPAFGENFVDNKDQNNQGNYGTSTYPFGGPSGSFGGEDGLGSLPNRLETLDSKGVNGQLGDVVHAFEPGSVDEKITKNPNSPFVVREAWDSTHSIFGPAPFSGLTEEEIRQRIAQNGSFNNVSGDEIKKSFTFDMPLNNSVLKSYRNPYSTVISTALPFAKGMSGFASGSDYDRTSTSDMNAGGFTGKYGTPPTNHWYENYHGSGNFSSVKDMTGDGKINIKGGNSTDEAKSLHLSKDTWASKRWEGSDKDKIGLHNVNDQGFTKFYNGSDIPTSPFARWTTSGGAQGKQVEDYDAWIESSGDKLKGRFITNTISTKDKYDIDPGNYPVDRDLRKVEDANNHDGFGNGDDDGKPFLKPNGRNVITPEEVWVGGSHRTIPGWKIDSGNVPANAIGFPSAHLVPDSTGVNLIWERDPNHFVVTNAKQSHYERHKQLAKNVGYVLINATNLSEVQRKKLDKYQIPAGPSSADNILDGVSNTLTFDTLTKLPTISPVDDNPTYRGGLIGVMSINGDNENPGMSISGFTNTNIVFNKLIKQDTSVAGSIYNNFIISQINKTNPRFDAFLETPGLSDNQTVRVDGKGEFASDTDLHYGLAWNDSSDLPQVKIKRSLNVQYLVPVSVARDVKTTWTQEFGLGNLVRDYKLYQDVTTEYNNYKMYLGDVRLGDGNGMDSITTNTRRPDVDPNAQNSIDTSRDSLANLLPVNNQIAYTRIDKSFPHYDSELFDHGSNVEDITINRDERDRNFVGTSKELAAESNSDRTRDGKDLGSSDDYSIGIVKAPKTFFNVDDNGVPTGGNFAEINNEVKQSTQNAADGRKGINKAVDTPENNNGMAIGKKESYATLSEAYNVNIDSSGKVTPKDDDTSSNKGDRVALVQQLMDNGGNSKAYYYIPSLPRLFEDWNKARINVVIYDKEAVPAPTKKDTKPSFSTTDISGDKISLKPYTTTYDDGAVLKESEVPQSFKNILANSLIAGNPDFANNTDKLQQILVSAFLGSWQQIQANSDTNSPLYLYGGFGISNSDTKNSYLQWPAGYTNPKDNTTKYHEAISNFSDDFYRGGSDLRDASGNVISGTKIPASAIKADASKVDITKAGSYPVVFTYTNPSNAKDTASITVPIRVTNQSSPVFTFRGSNDVTIKVGESFDYNAYKVVGSWEIFNRYNGNYDQIVNYEGIQRNSNGDPDVAISGFVDTSTPGIYQMTYKATNTSGATSTMTRTITVLPKETPTNDWTVFEYKVILYVHYVPGYGINVWNAPGGIFTGQRLPNGSAWKVFKKATNSKGETFYNVGKNQWVDGQYASFIPVSGMEEIDGVVTINYVPGYGVNLWKDATTANGFYEKRKLQDGTKWKTFGKLNGFYNVGTNQWVQGDYASYKAK